MARYDELERKLNIKQTSKQLGIWEVNESVQKPRLSFISNQGKTQSVRRVGVL